MISLAACATAVRSPGTTTLDIDYITIGEDAESVEDENGSNSLFGQMQQRLRADAQGQPAAQEASPSGDTSAQNNPDITAHHGGGSVPAGGGGTLGAGSLGSSSGQGSNQGGGSQPPASNNPDNPAALPEEDSGPAHPEANTVTMHIRADNFVASDHFDQSWVGIIHPSGVILPTTTFEFHDGDSVYDILRQAGRTHGILISSRGTTFGIYVEGIGGLFEFDGGQFSGWMYSVNGWYPNFGVARYFVQPGDRIEWNYTNDLGRDLPGGGWLAGS